MWNSKWAPKKLCKALKAVWFVSGLITCQLMLEGIGFLNQMSGTYCYTQKFSLFCSTLTFHRRIRRLPSVCCPREQESPTNWHWYNLQVMAACLQARGCLWICYMCVCAHDRFWGGTQHHSCGHRAKVQPEMCGPRSRGAMASVKGEAKVTGPPLFSRRGCHLQFSTWHAWQPPPLSQVTPSNRG